MRPGVLVLTALVIRVLSQLVWDHVGTTSLGMYEFMYGMIIVTHVWFVLEAAKLLTCLCVACLVHWLSRWIKEKFSLANVGWWMAYSVSVACLAYLNALLWLVIDDCYLSGVGC